MRKLSFITCLLMLISCYAYEIKTTILTDESLQMEEKVDIRLPAVSKASPGKVPRRKPELVSFSYSIFIIGDDEISYEWLKKHAKEIEEIQALGFVTNISESAKLDALQALVKAPLLPVNVDDLLALFNESHYPLIFHEGEIWQ